MKKIILIITIIILGSRFGVALAAETPKVDYGNNPVIDSDLDGLTDEGEKQIYHTDPNNPDTDGDGILDGAEVLAGTNPLDRTSPSVTKNITVLQYPEEERQLWSWYLTRAGGLISFLLLYLAIFFGIAIRFPGLKNIFQPLESYNFHAWISVQALVFTFIHGLVLLGDNYLKFSLKDIFVPFASTYNPELVTLGVLGMYALVAIILTSYFRKYLSYRVWRVTHFLNIALYALAFFHAYYLGTDLKSGIMREIFIGMNVLLLGLMFVSLFLKLKNTFAQKAEEVA
ncbi:MAG: ferric reductase-like transmembrane domain-containing protein [Candidatus Moranbacteria bacterium]|nr:ferric reductase-like transmembrane domain-containing protein [Candidatus Moranbacteria bacterium]